MRRNQVPNGRNQVPNEIGITCRMWSEYTRKLKVDNKSIINWQKGDIKR